MTKTKQQQRAHEAARIERLRRRLQAGCVLLPAADEQSIEPEPELTVQVIRPEQAKAHDFRCHIEFEFPARITNKSYAWLEVQRFKLRVAWDLPNPLWPRVDVHETKFYRLPGGRKFPYEVVLNHRIGKGIGPGESWEGFLLAVSMNRRIPGELLHGVEFRAQIVIIDQFGRHHTSMIEFRVDRTATMKKLSLNRRYGTGLYGPSSGEQASISCDQPSAVELKSVEPTRPSVGSTEGTAERKEKGGGF